MDIDSLMREVKAQSGRYNDLAMHSGISVSWISKFGRGVIRNPTIKTLSQVRKGLDQLNAGSQG